MNKTKHAFIGCLAFLLLSSAVVAQGPPIFTQTPVMLGLEGRGVRTFGKVNLKEHVTAYAHPVAIPYNLNDDLQVGGIAPFVYKNPNKEGLEAQMGLGDVSAFFKTEVFQQDRKGKTFRGLIKLQETFPTGDTDEQPSLGSGEYRTQISAVTGYITTNYGVYADLGYSISSRSATERFRYNVAFGYPLLPQTWPPRQLNLYLEANGDFRIDEKKNALFISPGIQYIASKKVLLEAGVQVPLQEEVPSTRQTHVKLTAGARILIF